MKIKQTVLIYFLVYVLIDAIIKLQHILDFKLYKNTY